MPLNLNDSSDPAVPVRAACPLGVFVDETDAPTTELPSELRIKIWMLPDVALALVYPICAASPRITINAIRWDTVLFPSLFFNLFHQEVNWEPLLIHVISFI